ncbi:hypothetical protein GCM10027614_54870 [Micromonospora vulcania]
MVGSSGVSASITGSTGRIDLPEPFFRPGALILHRDGAEPETIVDEGIGGGYQYEAIEVQRCLAAGLTESPLVPHATTLEVMALLDTIREQIGVRYE